MEISSESCRLCLKTTEFNASLFSSYSKNAKLLDKILTCYNIDVLESDYLTCICYKCAGKLEDYYESIRSVEKSQRMLDNLKKPVIESRNMKAIEAIPEADYTFSFLDTSINEEPNLNQSSTFFSYYTSPHVSVRNCNDYKWKTPQIGNSEQTHEKPRRQSRDLFESPSQDEIEPRSNSMDWNLTPDEEIIRRVREKCFGRSDY